jgi:predicted methyltransferase
MHFTVEAQKLVHRYLRPGDVVIDATAGNGHDTLFLADSVGPLGKVYAIDIQPQAIERLRETLAKSGLLDRVELVIADHANLEQIVAPKLHEAISCAMFNLGYLPHSDKSITTNRTSTLAAIQGAFNLLKPGGLVTVIAYVGHAGGREEADGVEEWIMAHAVELDFTRIQDSGNPTSPILWEVRRRGEYQSSNSSQLQA